MHAEKAKRRSQPKRSLEPGVGPRDRRGQARRTRRTSGPREHLPHQVELDDKAGRRGRTPKAREQPVVTAALSHRPSEVGAVTLEDDARVVVEVANGAEVEAHGLAKPIDLEQLTHPAELLQRPLRAAVAHEA